MRMMAKPMYFQVRMPNIVHIAMSGSASQLRCEVAEADGREGRVDAAVRLQQELPGEAGDDLGEHVGDEDEQAEEPRGRASCG